MSDQQSNLPLDLESPQFPFSGRPFAYVLNEDYSVRPVRDYKETDRSFNDDRRFILREVIGEFTVSTVFLVIAHFNPFDNNPYLFETSTFASITGYVDSIIRYATYAEAIKGHHDVVALLSNNLSISENKSSQFSAAHPGVRVIRVHKL